MFNYYSYFKVVLFHFNVFTIFKETTFTRWPEHVVFFLLLFVCLFILFCLFVFTTSVFPVQTDGILWENMSSIEIYGISFIIAPIIIFPSSVVFYHNRVEALNIIKVCQPWRMKVTVSSYFKSCSTYWKYLIYASSIHPSSDLMWTSAIEISMPEPAVCIPFIDNGEKQWFLESSLPPLNADA